MRATPRTRGPVRLAGLATLTVLATLAASLSVAPAPASAAAAAPAGQPGQPGQERASGMAWSSGVALPGNEAGRAEEFAAWRGRPLDVVVDFTGRESWSDITSPAWLLDQRAQTAASTHVLSVAMLPDDPSATLAGCAAGAYDEHWAELGSTLAATGRSERIVVRLGWEFNGNWQKWSATDPAAFVGCWRHAHDAVAAQAPQVRWEWGVNRGVGQGLPDAGDAYPGDAYVDVVGLSSYDVFPAVVDEQTWRQHWDGELGLNAWADFAARHGKQVAVSEWGVYPGFGNTGPNGGDNAYYVAKMQAWFAAVSPQLAYEAYFNESSGYFAGSLVSPEQNPQAAAAYRAGL